MTAFDVLERQLHDAAAGRRRRRRARPLAVLALAAAVLAAFVLVDRGGGPTSPPADEREVTAPPVAFLSPDPDKIVYVRVTSIVTEPRERAVVEDWHRGSESRKLDRWTDADGKDWAVESVIDADGVMRRIDETGGYRVIRKTDMEDARTTIEQQQAGYLADFQRRAEQGTLDPAAHVFNGRSALRYHVPHDPKRVGPAGPDQSYYVDRETGGPLGFTSELQMGPDRTMRVTQTVEEIKLLDPTPENLAQLRELTLERRSR